MSPNIAALLLYTLGLGTTLTFVSSHWLLAWMGLEINTLAIIPLMCASHHPRAVEATTKYFLVQATAAATILFASITNAWLTGQWNIYSMTHPVPTTIILLALSMKVGLAPLHIWLPEVLQGLDLTTGLILATWQKLAPLALILQLPLQNQTIAVLIALISMLVGGWGGLNQTQMRKLLAYSSVAHLGWMMIIIQFSPPLTVLALATYLVMTTTAFLVTIYTDGHTISALANARSKAPLLTSIFLLVLLSLGGLPPLSGFLPKWMILQELTKQGLPLTALLAATTALLSLYFYLRIAYGMTVTISPSSLTRSASWRLSPRKKALALSVFALLSALSVPLAPAIITLFK